MFAVLVAMLIGVADISPVVAQSSNGWSFGLGWPGTDGPIYAIAAEGRYVYVAGEFTRAGNVSAQNIARWDRTNFEWSALDAGVNGPVRALALADGKLYVGGDFTQAGALGTISPLAIWDTTGFSWSLLGTGLAGNVTAIAADNTSVFVGGMFSRVGATAYPSKVSLVRYTHSSQQWSVINSSSSDLIRALALSSPDLYVGGTFLKSTIEGTYNYTQNVARWRGSWHDMAGGVTVGAMVTDLAVDSAGSLYATGEINVIGGRVAHGIARWDGQSWSAMGNLVGLGNKAGLLAVGSSIFVGRSATANDCGFTKGIARWNGTTWQHLDAGVDGQVYALAAVGDELFVGGSFSRAGGNPVSNFARWDLRIPFDSDQPGSYVIEGYLNDERSKPVPGATITAEGGQVALSDTNGLFTLRGLSPGAHTLTVVRDGYTFPAGQTFTVPPCLGRVTITGDALINNFTIGGTVELSDQWVRKAPPQVTITAQRVTDTLMSTQTITAGAPFTLTGLEPGTYKVSVAIPGEPALDCSDDNPDAYRISPCARQVEIPPDGQQVSFELRAPRNRYGGSVQISLPPSPTSNNALRVSYVVHAHQADTQGWAVQLELLNAAGQSIIQREIPVSAQVLTWWETAVFDPLNPGAYQLRYTLRNAEGVFYGPYIYPFHVYKQADPRLVALADQLRDTSKEEIYNIGGFIIAVHTDTVGNVENAYFGDLFNFIGSDVLKKLESLFVFKHIAKPDEIKGVGGEIYGLIDRYSNSVDWFVKNYSDVVDFSSVASGYVMASLQPTWDIVQADNQVFRDYLTTIPALDQASIEHAEQEADRYETIIARRAEDEPVFGVGAPPGTIEPASFDAILQQNPATLFLGETTLLNQDFFYSWTNRLKEAIEEKGEVFFLILFIGLAILFFVPSGGTSSLILAAVPELLTGLGTGMGRIALGIVSVQVCLGLLMWQQGVGTVAPAVQREHAAALSTLRAILPAPAVANANAQSLSLETALTQRSGAAYALAELRAEVSAPRPVTVTTYFFTADGQLIDADSQTAALQPNTPLLVQQQVPAVTTVTRTATIVRDGTTILARAMSAPAAAAPSLSLQLTPSTQRVSLGQSVEVRLELSNSGALASGDLVVQLANADTIPQAAWAVQLEPGQRWTATHTFTPQTAGAKIVYVQVVSGRQILARKAIPIAVGSGPALAADLDPTGVISPGVALTLPVTVANAGDTDATAALTFEAYDIAARQTPIYTATATLSPGAGGQATQPVTLLSAALAKPGRYQIEVSLDHMFYGSYEVTVAAERTLFATLASPTNLAALGSDVTLEAHVTDEQLSPVDIPLQVRVIVPDGTASDLAGVRVGPGRYTVTVHGGQAGTYSASLLIDAPRAQVFTSGATFAIEQASRLLLNVTGNPVVGFTRPLTVTLRNDLNVPLRDAWVMIEGTGVLAMQKTDASGQVVAYVTPEDAAGLQVQAYKPGFAESALVWPVSTPMNSIAPRLSIDVPHDSNQTSLDVLGQVTPGASVQANRVVATVDASGHFTATLALAEGPNQILVEAIGANGAISRAGAVVLRDTVAPLLSVDLANPVSSTATIHVTGTTDPAAAVMIGDRWITVDPVSGRFAAWVHALSTETQLEIRAQDAAGNTTLVMRNISRDTTQRVYIPLIRR
jgi:hypothetical protein